MKLKLSQLRKLIKEAVMDNNFEYYYVEINNADSVGSEFETFAEAETYFNDPAHGMDEILWEEGYSTEVILKGVRANGEFVVLNSRTVTPDEVTDG